MFDLNSDAGRRVFTVYEERSLTGNFRVMREPTWRLQCRVVISMRRAGQEIGTYPTWRDATEADILLAHEMKRAAA